MKQANKQNWYWYHSVWVLILLCVFLIEGILFLNKFQKIDKKAILGRLSNIWNTATTIETKSENKPETKSPLNRSELPIVASKEAILLRKPRVCASSPLQTITPDLRPVAPVDTTSFDTKSSYSTYRFVINHIGVPVYEIDMPDDWVAFTETRTNANTVHFGKARNIYEGARTNSYSEITITFYYDPDLAALDPLEWDSEDARYLFDGILPAKWVETSVNGIPAKRGVVAAYGSSDTVYFTKKNILFTAANRSADTAIFNRMLSTFKLVETDYRVISRIPQETNVKSNKINWNSKYLDLQAENFYVTIGRKRYFGFSGNFEITSKKVLDDKTKKIVYLLETTWCEGAEPIGLYIKAIVSPRNKTWMIDQVKTISGRSNEKSIIYFTRDIELPITRPYIVDSQTFSSQLDQDNSNVHFDNLVVTIKE